MNRLLNIILLWITALFSTAYCSDNELLNRDKEQPVVHPLVSVYQMSTTAEMLPVWIFFTCKSNSYKPEHDETTRPFRLPERTLRRRAKVMINAGIDYHDLPVNASFIDTLSLYGFTRRHNSTWLNAVSGYLPRTRLDKVARLPFVREIRLLPPATKRQQQFDFREKTSISAPRQNHLLHYGNSAIQLEMLNVPALHDLGLSGNGILICLLDTGYDLRHNALQSVKVIAEYDFINHDSVTINEPDKDPPGQDEHGTKVLSVVAGNSPGELYGTAYGASFLLGKTEILDAEVIIEEDNWVACIEWAERQGADIASSSLIYNEWYSYNDMDGNTAIITRVADMAVARGMIVTVSSGNERNSEWYYISAPADADSVISIGAVDRKGMLASFSSGGPTVDGRIKPEVVALGKAVLAVNPGIPSAYSYVDGTSFANPLIAGVCALLLEAHPYWTPMQVREALMQTADRAHSPDNNYGWGLVNALAALNYRQPGDVNGDDRLNHDDVYLMAQFILSTSQPEPDVFKSADINGDGVLNVCDLILLINRLDSLPVK